MEKIGPFIRRLREEKGDPLRMVADYLDMDIAILSKIERGKRKVQRKHIDLLARYYEADKETLLVCWLSSKILDEVHDEKYAIEALNEALRSLREEKMKPSEREIIIHKISSYLRKDGRIKKAWVYGDFVRKEDVIPDSIDIMLEELDKNDFSYFDLAEIQSDLENLLSRKIELAFTSSMSEYVVENLMKDAELVYDNLNEQKK